MSGRLTLSPPLYIDSRPVQPSQLLTPLLPEGELILKTKKACLEHANDVVPDSQKAFEDFTTRMTDGLRTEAAVLRTLTQSSWEIQSQLNQTVANYNESLKLFPTKQITLIATQVNLEDDSLAAQFRAAKESFKIYHRPRSNEIKDPPRHLCHKPPPDPSRERESRLRDWRNGYLREEQKSIINGMKVLHYGSTAINLTGAVIAKGVKAVCNLNSGTQKVCETTVDLVKKGKDSALAFTGTTEIVEKGLAYWRSLDGSSLKDELVRRSFPPEQAERLAKQSVEDAKTASIVLTAIAALKAGGILLGKIGQFGKRPLPFATDTDGLVYKVYFTHPQLSAPSLRLPAPVNTPLSTRSVTVRVPSTRSVTVWLPSNQLYLPAPASVTAASALQISTSATTLPKLTSAAASSTPSPSATGSLVELGKASNVDKTLHQIYSTIESLPPHQSLDQGIHLSRKRPAKTLPVLSSAEKTRLATLRSQLSDPTTDASRTLALKEFKNLTAAVKAAIGSDILRSLGLRYLAIPKLVALGISNGSTKRLTPFALSLQEGIEEAGIGPNILSSEEHMRDFALHTGRAEAELQTKSSRFPLFVKISLRNNQSTGRLLSIPCDRRSPRDPFANRWHTEHRNL